jgi:Chaperone of endosialidase
VRTFILCTSIFCFSIVAKAQNVGIGTTTPNTSAILDVNSNDKGILIPQIALDSLKDITKVASPANGLMVYNTTQPGVRSDLKRGFYYYNVTLLSWVRLTDNVNDNAWQSGGLLGIQLRDKANGVEMMDNYTGSATNWGPKVKILKMIDSALLNAKNNINALVLTGVNRKTTAGWKSRQKTSIVFENTYLLTDGITSGTNNVAISSYTENPGTTANNFSNGLGFYSFATPNNAAVADTPTMSMFRHNIGIGHYATDINNVTEGRLQITGFTNGDQLSLRHPSSINLKWGLYVSDIDSSLNFYSNGSLRANIDRVTGVFTALSDRSKKKNVQPLQSVLDNIKQLPVYTYNYLDSKDDDHRMIGMMAQDVQPYFPELVYQRYDREITKPVLTMDYSGMSMVAIKAIQEQQQIIDQLVKRIELLEKKLER